MDAVIPYLAFLDCLRSHSNMVVTWSFDTNLTLCNYDSEFGGTRVTCSKRCKMTLESLRWLPCNGFMLWLCDAMNLFMVVIRFYFNPKPSQKPNDKKRLKFVLRKSDFQPFEVLWYAYSKNSQSQIIQLRGVIKKTMPPTFPSHHRISMIAMLRRDV